ncbi:Hypothetical predicted protein, partial [Marmota monax]
VRTFRVERIMVKFTILLSPPLGIEYVCRRPTVLGKNFSVSDSLVMRTRGVAFEPIDRPVLLRVDTESIESVLLALKFRSESLNHSGIR